MEEFIKKELENYLNTNLTDNAASCVDDVILSYIITVLSQVSQEDDCTIGSIDTEELMELFMAYIPEINDINRSSLSEWLFDSSKKFHSFSVKKEKTPKPVNRKAAKKKSNVTETVESNNCSTETVNKSGTANYDNGIAAGDTTLKEFVVNRFAYTEDTEGKEHHPVIVQKEKEKMVRYRDNVVVSTRGERYTIESNKDNDEMKKTYINLKPLRKYRFHK